MKYMVGVFYGIYAYTAFIAAGRSLIDVVGVGGALLDDI